jgi:hypothetical protein
VGTVMLVQTRALLADVAADHSENQQAACAYRIAALAAAQHSTAPVSAPDSAAPTSATPTLFALLALAAEATQAPNVWKGEAPQSAGEGQGRGAEQGRKVVWKWSKARPSQASWLPGLTGCASPQSDQPHRARQPCSTGQGLQAVPQG